MLNYDNIEFDDQYQEIFLKVNSEVKKTLDKKGIKEGFGYIHIFESYKKKLLKEKYHIDWKTTREMNPGISID